MTVPRLGAWLDDDGAASWRVWAPGHAEVEVVLAGGAPFKLEREGDFFSGRLARPPQRVLYKLRVDGAGPYPDPWSRSQPLGVHGPSEVVTDHFAWTDIGWRGVPLDELIIEEFHVGTATTEGTFDALIPVLEHVRKLGVTAIELMPVASFPGRRNWGYDGVSLFAPSANYGGPGGLRRLVNAAHSAGIGVLLDVVYNHLGPDGNYLACYSDHYFTPRHSSPWGDGINFDGRDSSIVRELFLSNAEMWIRDFHLDGMRLDATHAIVDDSPTHIVQEVARRARAAAPSRQVVVIAEDDRNEATLLRSVAEGGLGLDAVWADDFHHLLRRMMAGDSDGYFRDYPGGCHDLARTLTDGWLYQGEHSEHFGRARGSKTSGIPPRRFVHCLQNHDQIGNRALGDRLGKAVSPEGQRAMAALLLLSPGVPLLFMGQEWDASTPFLYFTDHNEELGRAVTEGRRREFSSFASFSSAEVPDPQADWTFECSRLDWTEMVGTGHREMLAWYEALIRLRRSHGCSAEGFTATAPDDNTLSMDYPGLVALFIRSGTARLSVRGMMILSSEQPEFGGQNRATIRDGILTCTGPAAFIFRV